jgi:peptidylprolyl isomerase
MDEQVIETSSGLGYVEIVEGTGPTPKTGDSVSVHYTGWLKSGQKFDSSHDRGEPLVFPLGRGRVIKGWDEGVGTMRVGGKRKLIIPAHLGYGDRGAGGVIPPGATLVFEVELVGITKG